MYVNRDAIPLSVDLSSAHDQEGKSGSHSEAFNSNGQIRHGVQYDTLIESAGDEIIRGQPLQVILETARFRYDNFLENPNNWANVERGIRSIHEKQQRKGPYPTAGALIRGAISELVRAGVLEIPVKNGAHEQAEIYSPTTREGVLGEIISRFATASELSRNPVPPTAYIVPGLFPAGAVV